MFSRTTVSPRWRSAATWSKRFRRAIVIIGSWAITRLAKSRGNSVILDAEPLLILGFLDDRLFIGAATGQVVDLFPLGVDISFDVAAFGRGSRTAGSGCACA